MQIQKINWKLNLGINGKPYLLAKFGARSWKSYPTSLFCEKKTDIFFCENIDPQFKQVSQKFCLCSINTRRVSYCTKNEVFH